MPRQEDPAPSPAPTPSIIYGIPGPQKLTLDGDPALNFRRFKRSWAVYENGSRINVQQADVRSAILQSFLSPEVQEMLESSF